MKRVSLFAAAGALLAGLMIGDGVAALMDDNGTATVYDDVIVTVRYAG